MSDRPDTREEAYALLAEGILHAAASNGLTVEQAFDAVMADMEHGVAALLGIEFCDCADHAKH